MKHPSSGEFMMPVDSRLNDKLRALGEAAFVQQDSTLWATAEILSKLTGEEYFIVNEDFDPVVRVDFDRCVVNVDERGGWSRTYSKSFSELQELASRYEVVFDIEAERKAVAELGYKLIYAENARYHGLSFERYFPIPQHRFLPPLPAPEVDGKHFTMQQMLDYGELCRDQQDEDED